MRSWMAVCVRRMRQKMEPKIRALLTLTPARDKLVALSRVTCRHERPKSSLRAAFCRRLVYAVLPELYCKSCCGLIHVRSHGPLGALLCN